MVSNNVLFSSNKVFAHTTKHHLTQILQKKIFGKGLRKAKNCKIIAQKQPNCIIKAELKFDRIFLKFGQLTSNYITKLSTYARHNYEIFENFGAMLMVIECTAQKTKYIQINLTQNFQFWHGIQFYFEAFQFTLLYIEFISHKVHSKRSENKPFFFPGSHIELFEQPDQPNIY